MQSITIVGNLTGDPELRVTPNGKTVVNLRIAVNQGSGENEQTTFVNVSAWDSLAENIAHTLRRGHRAIIMGRFTERPTKYLKKDGTQGDGTTLEMIATAVGPDLKWAQGNMVKVVREAPAEAQAAVPQAAPAQVAPTARPQVAYAPATAQVVEF